MWDKRNLYHIDDIARMYDIAPRTARRWMQGIPHADKHLGFRRWSKSQILAAAKLKGR